MWCGEEQEVPGCAVSRWCRGCEVCSFTSLRTGLSVYDSSFESSRISVCNELVQSVNAFVV